MQGWWNHLSVRFAKAAAGLSAAFRRFPVTILLFGLVVLRVNWPFGPDYQKTLRQLDDYDGLVATSVLPLLAGAVLSLAGALFAESTRWSRPAALGVAAVCGAVGFALITWHDPLGVYFGSALPAIGGAVLVAPYLRGGGAAQLWRYLMRLGRAALFAGMAAIVAGVTLSVLLSLAGLIAGELTETTYFRAWSLAFLVAAPLTGLSFIPRAFAREATLDPDRLDIGVIRVLLDLLVVPFLLVYALLLHGYALLVLIKRDIPDGQTGFFVLAFCLALLATVAVLSHFAELSGRPARLLLRIWPVLLPLPIALLLVAGSLRIADAGVTPDRYLFVLFGVVLTIIVALQLNATTRGDIRYLLIVPVAALFIASFGPQGALATSIRSQTARFMGMVKTTPYTVDEARAARTALYFLDRYNALGPVLPPNVPPTDSDGDTALRARVAEAYGLNRIVDAPTR